MVGINNVVLLGRIVKDPELRAFREKHYATFTLAVERPASEGKTPKVDFIPCVCWNERVAEFTAANAAKGALLGVAGRLAYETKKLENNTYKVNSNVIVNNVFLYEYKKMDNMPVNMNNLPEYTSNNVDVTGRLDPNEDLPF